MTEKAVNFFVTMRCLMICKDENCPPTLRLRGGKLLAGAFDIGSNPPRLAIRSVGGWLE